MYLLYYNNMHCCRLYHLQGAEFRLRILVLSTFSVRERIGHSLADIHVPTNSMAGKLISYSWPEYFVLFQVVSLVVSVCVCDPVDTSLLRSMYRIGIFCVR